MCGFPLLTACWSVCRRGVTFWAFWVCWSCSFRHSGGWDDDGGVKSFRKLVGAEPEEGREIQLRRGLTRLGLKGGWELPVYFLPHLDYRGTIDFDNGNLFINFLWLFMLDRRLNCTRSACKASNRFDAERESLGSIFRA